MFTKIAVALLFSATLAFEGIGAAVSNGLRIEFPGVVGEETLVRFPVAVRLSEKIDGFTYHKYNENDIRFHAEDGTEIPFEIDTWNTNGESLVWIQVPELTKSTALYIRATGNGKKTYSDMWTDYAAVWHMNSLTKLKDSTVNGYDADFYAPSPAPAGLELRLVHAGPSHEQRLGAAVRWPGSNAGYIGFTVANLYQQKLYNQSAMSVEAAVSLGASADSGSYARIFQIGNGASATAMRSQRSNTKNSPASNKGYGFMSTIWTEQAGTGSLNAGTPHPDPNEYAEYVAGVKFYTPGALAFHGMSYNGAKLDNFTGNAAEMISLTDTKNFSGKISRSIGSNLFTIGCRQDNKQNWYDGEIDELRISAVARNANWMENCRRSMLSPDTYVSFRYVRGEVPVYNVAEGVTKDVSDVDWLGGETDRIIVDGKGTLNLGANLPLTITIRGNNTLQIDDTGAKSPDSNLVFDHDEASVTLDVTIPDAHLQLGRPVEVLTGTSFTMRDEVRVKGLIRVKHEDGTITAVEHPENVKVSIVNGNVYLTYGTNPNFEFDIDKGSLTLKTAGTYDLAEYDFPITKLVVNKPVTLKDYQMGNDLAGRPLPGIDLTLGAEGTIDLQLLADDNYFVGQEALVFNSVTGERDGAIKISWASTGALVQEGNKASNGLEGEITKVGGKYLFTATASANPLIDIDSYECSFEIDFPSFTDDKTIITNFPVGVVFSNSIPGFNYTSVHSDSLRFVDEYGNNLPYEIENGAFNKLGNSVVWVRVPYFHKDLTITACVRLAGDVAPVFEGDRAMCPHPDSSDASFDPTFARVQFNPDLRNVVFYAPKAEDVVDVTMVDFSQVDHDLVTKRGPGTIRFGASVPNELKIEEGSAEFTAEVTPAEITVSGTENIVDEEGNRIPSVITITLPMGNDFADNEAALKELDLTDNAAKVTINVKPSAGLYVGQVQDVIRTLTGDTSKMTVQLTNPGAVAGDLRIDTENTKVVFTCSKSEVPLITSDLAAKYWCKANISFPQMEGVGEAMTNFPVAVRFNENITGFRYRTANFAETLRFADAEGNDLPYEIDGYDEQGTTLVWVMIPYFTDGTQITAYWGLDEADKSLIAAPQVAHVGPRAPFHNYAAVWHMDVRNDKSILDSTLNGFDLTFFGSSLGGFDLSSGHIGRGVTWPKNSSGNGWAVKNGLYEKKLGFRPGLSTEIIATSSDSFKHESVLLCTTRQSNYNHGYLKVDPGTHGASRFHVAKNAEVNEHIAPTDYPESSITAWQTKLNEHEPLFFGGVFNGAAHKVFNYINDCEDSHDRDEIDQMPLIETNNVYDVSDVRVGSREGAVDYDFQGGMIDEVRISNKARSSAWMNQVYETFFNANYSAMTIDRDGSITIHVEEGETFDATGTDYDTRVVHKTGAGAVIFGSAPDILDLQGGTAEFTLTDAANLPFEIIVAHATKVKGIPLTPGYSAPTKFTIAENAQWTLDLKVEDLLWKEEVVPVIPHANETSAANVTITLSGSSAASQMTAVAQVSNGAVLVCVTESPRGFQKWSNYDHMMTIYFSGYNELETLEDFPALIKLADGTGRSETNEGFKYSQLKYKPTDDVFDLRFADYQGNEIPYEIDTWNDKGTSFIWVSVPKLAAGGRILMYWGHNDAEALLPTDYTGEHHVWKDYDLVLHFNDLQVKDQTENHNDPEQYKFNPRFKVVDSAVGRSVYFDGRKYQADGVTLDLDKNGKVQYVRVPNSGYILRDYYQNWMLGATNHTIETISTMSSSIPGYAKLMSVTRTRTGSYSQYGGWNTGHYLYRLTADGDICGVWGSFVYSVDGPASNGQRWYSSYWTPNGEKPSELDKSKHIPVFAGCVFDGENREFTDYTAGKYATRPMEVRTIMGESTSGYDPVTIGFRYEYDDQEWRDNELDEFRMCRKARSPAWMNAVNANALHNEDFCTYTVEAAHANEKPIVNTAIVNVNAAGGTLLVSLPNAGYIGGTRTGSAMIYAKVWEVGQAEPEFSELRSLSEGGHMSYADMSLKPETTYHVVVYAKTTLGETSLDSNIVKTSFRTLSRGIVVNQEKTTGGYTEEHHARLHIAQGGAGTETAVLDHPGYIEMLVVGAGGMGGSANSKGPGSGGGAGGLFYRPAMWVEAGTYQIAAAGPTKSGATAAGDSYFGSGLYHVSGGGRGMGWNDSNNYYQSVAGGSGGGGFSSSAQNMTMGTGDQGFWGGFPAGVFPGADTPNWYSWAGAGGGGATRDGGSAEAEEFGILGDAGQGGEGRVICITGREEFYGGGGSGGVARSDDNRAGKATYAGGGAGGDGRHINGYDGVDGTGGGGGGGAWYPGKENLYPESEKGQGGAGGSGIVVWRYTPIPTDINAGPVVMFSEIRGDNMSANLTIPVICLGKGKGEDTGTYTDDTSDDGKGNYVYTRSDRVCTLYFEYGVDRFNLDHQVLLTKKAHLGEHEFKVPGLLRNQAYWGRVRAVDGVGHEFVTRELPFETTDEGDDRDVDVGYPRLGTYSYVTTNGHNVTFTGEMLTDGVYDITLYLAENVNDLVCKSGEGVWNNKYSVYLDTSANGKSYTIAANDLKPGMRYWYMIEAADANPAHEKKTTYEGMGLWYEYELDKASFHSATIPMKDRTHHQYTTFITPYEANLSRTYHEIKDFENAEEEVPVTFEEVLKETGSLPARLELCITKVNENTYADDHAVATWPLTTNEDGEGGCGKYSFTTNFPYGTMIKYHWRVVNTIDDKFESTDTVRITTYVGNPNLFYWIRPSSEGPGDWNDPKNWENPNVNYKDMNGNTLPLNEWPLPGVDSTVIFTNMVNGATVNLKGDIDVLRVNLSIGTNKIKFVGVDGENGEKAKLITKFFKTSGSGSELTFDNIIVPMENIDFDWMRETYIEEGSSGTETRESDVSSANLTVTNNAEVAVRYLTFAPLTGTLKVTDGATLSVGAGELNGILNVGGGVNVIVDNATLDVGTIHLEHHDLDDPSHDSRYGKASQFDFHGADAKLNIEHVIGNRYGNTTTPFVFHVPEGGFTGPVVTQKGLAGLSAFGFGFRREEVMGEDGQAIVKENRGRGAVDVQIAEDSPAYRSVRTVNPTLIKAEHGFWNEVDPYVVWWVREYHKLAVTPRATFTDIPRSWRKDNEVYFDKENEVTGNYGPTLLKARITGTQRTVIAVEAHDGEVVHRRGTIKDDLDLYKNGDKLPDVDRAKWSFEEHNNPFNDSFVRALEKIVAEAETEESETNHEVYVGVDEGLLAMTAIKNMDAFSTYVDAHIKVKTAWEDDDPIDICPKAKIGLSFSQDGHLVVLSGDFANTANTVTNVTNFAAQDGDLVRISIQAARNKDQKEYFKIAANGTPVVAAGFADSTGSWCIPDALKGKVFPARTAGENPIGMGKVGFAGTAVLRKMTVGARPPAGLEEAFTHPTSLGDGTIVPIPFTYLDAVRKDNDTTSETIAQSTWGNGYKLWASYALGLDPTDPESVFWTDGKINTANVENYLLTPKDVEAPEGSLAEIGYDLEYSRDRENWAKAYTLLGTNANFRISNYSSPETKDIATFVRLVATVAGAKVTSTNFFGAVRIESNREKSAVGVPWVRSNKHITENLPIQLSEYVTTGDLEEGDMIYVLGPDHDRYLAWVYKDKEWQSVKTVSMKIDGEIVEQGGAATETGLNLGEALWIVRNNPSGRFHLVGQFPVAELKTQIEANKPNLIANPLGTAFDFSGVTEGVNAKDQIFVPQADGSLKLYTFENGAWGTWVKTTKKVGNRTLVTTTWKTDQNIIPIGQGFWYVSAGGTPILNWKDGEVKEVK